MPYTSGLSSLSFSMIPHLYDISPILARNTRILSLCSAQYHIYTEYCRRYNRYRLCSKSTKQRISEGIDGMGIVLTSSSAFTSEPTSIALTLFYLSCKLTSNIDLVKNIIYGIAVVHGVYRAPVVFIPWIVGAGGFYHYKTTGHRWNHWNRTLWHIGNSLYIGIGCRLLYQNR